MPRGSSTVRALLAGNYYPIVTKIEPERLMLGAQKIGVGRNILMKDNPFEFLLISCLFLAYGGGQSRNTNVSMVSISRLS
jgi:hypothetical protein